MVVDTGGNHADLTPEYSAIPAEMKAVAAHFGKAHCREVAETEILSDMETLRKKTGDRAILRALHFLHDNARVESQVEALKSDDIATFLHQVSSSGRSSFCYLQNVYAGSAPDEQGISLALNLTESFLHGEGACRVHGGGFAGTIQVYIPNGRAADYIRYMTPFFGKGSVTPLRIRPPRLHDDPGIGFFYSLSLVSLGTEVNQNLLSLMAIIRLTQYLRRPDYFIQGRRFVCWRFVCWDGGLCIYIC